MKILLLALVASVSALYSSKDDVIELTSANFQNKVINSNDIWIVEFFAPWCGHCKNLVPAYKKAATALKGIVKVGSVDSTQHQDIAGSYNVRGYPTIKIFGADKKNPTDFNGDRSAQGIANAGLEAAKKAVNARLGGGGSGGSSGGSRGGSGGGNDVVELTDDNFEKLVLNSKDTWLVEFFAPWCGHCKHLEPHWKAAASQLKGQVKLGALDATVHTVIANKFNIRGFPTIKYFAPGSSASDAADYEGGRTTDDIVSFATSKAQENLPAPEVIEGINQEVVEGACKGKQLNDYIKVLKELSEKFKKNQWGWIWMEAGSQSEIESAFDVGGFGYPAMTAFNYRKMKYAMLKGSFGKDGIHEFLRDLSYGKGQTLPLRGAEFPKVAKIDAWDGKDGKMPEVEEIDLSDIDLSKEEL